MCGFMESWERERQMKSTKVKMSMVPRGSAQDLPAGHLDPMGMGMGLRELRDDLSVINNSRSDWKETAEAHVLTAQVLGLTREELRVEVEEDRVLQVSGERCVERVERTDNCRGVERCSGKFVRRFKFPDDADAEQIKSSLERGVLTITVPKMQPRLHDP